MAKPFVGLAATLTVLLSLSLGACGDSSEPTADNGKKTVFATVDKKMSLDHDDFWIIST